MSVYVVDYENVQANGLSKIEKLSDKDVVIIFYSVNQTKIDADIVKRMLRTKAEVWLKEANVKIEETNKSFHDALDMQLATYMGSARVYANPNFTVGAATCRPQQGCP